MISTLLSSKIAGAIACAAIGVTGAAGAAYANVLPRPIQDIAHNTIGAPPTHSDPRPARPLSQRRPCGRRECERVRFTDRVTVSLGVSGRSAPVRRMVRCREGKIDDDAANVHTQLATLAGGNANIAAFCATVGDRDNDEHHGATPSPAATASAGDDQRHDQGDDHGRDGASASPTQGSNRGPSPSPSTTRTDNSGPGKHNGSQDNSGPGNNNGSQDNSGPGNNKSDDSNDGRAGNDGPGKRQRRLTAPVEPRLWMNRCTTGGELREFRGQHHQVLWTAKNPKSSFVKGLAGRSQDR